MPKTPEKPPGKPEAPDKKEIARVQLTKRAEAPSRQPSTGERLAQYFSLQLRAGADEQELRASMQRMLDHARDQFLFLSEGDLDLPEADALVEKFHGELMQQALEGVDERKLYTNVQSMIERSVQLPKQEDPRRE